MTRIVLIGFRGSGKTTIGRVLAERLDLPLYDTDALIEEETGSTIPEIFRTGGEEGFRALERAVIRLVPPDGCIVSCGGGAVLDPENVAIIRPGSLVVLLDAPADILERRIEGSDRPALTGLPSHQEVLLLMQKRRPAYCRSADICISTRNRDKKAIAEEIMSFFQGGHSFHAIMTARERLRPVTVLNPDIPGPSESHADVPVLRSLYAVIGNPCGHSRSPVLFTGLFHQHGISAGYIGLQPGEIGDIWDDVVKSGIRGLSVTIPFKETIIPFLDTVSKDATAIGAVNTVIFCCGRTVGLNTDWKGIYDSLENAGGTRALVIGAGGGAAAAVYAARKRGFSVTVAGRTMGRARALADRIGATALSLEDVSGVKPDLLINATPVGMSSDQTLAVPADLLRPGMTVFDLVYTPPDTPLIRAARQRGCVTIPGTEMFINQACAQFYHFTGIHTDRGNIRRILS